MLPPTADLERRVVELFAHWRVPAGAPVCVAWNHRLVTTAGRAFGAESRIELNPTLLAHAPRDLDTVLAHEAAHLATHRLFGPRTAAHGRHWRALMRLAGLPPAVTHELPVRARRRRRLGYLFLRVCAACGGRRVARIVNYARCGCGVGERFFVMRAPANEDGLQALRTIPLHEVRRRCIMARPTR